LNGIAHIHGSASCAVKRKCLSNLAFIISGIARQFPVVAARAIICIPFTRPQRHQAWRQMTLFAVNPYFGVTPPDAEAESGENNHRCDDDQSISQCARLGGSRRNCRRLRHGDGLFTGRTIDLRSRMTGIALNVLAAERAGEFEFSHKFYWPQNVPASELLTPKTKMPSRGKVAEWFSSRRSVHSTLDMVKRLMESAYFKFAGFNGFKSFGRNIPSLRINSPSNHT